ncbi:hypothetical protein M406DRAFT_268379 [Cryphonectria parasitica EP155]|uniref:Zn(2)-C6 fungal-type domain-containing protein n=1 Tax=Cryphonectria parasitica (strain ATCC 38755 / EP155) TaxID=660469 RepID=A0A9P4XU18_CRYP1|nr:uncharacterized protein M406DRAFT_268379 [Cryphonectria parasitica EP155]KAF3761009.1 hypothetical protein M406DRAFT_268379 [Cryphonectria parasitica EP155]
MPRQLRLETCWTCRLRRKKCDGTRPTCRNCADLNIECHVGAHKPAWMNDEATQREMARRISDRIKEGAVGRRVRQGRGGGEVGQGDESFRILPVITNKTSPLESASGSQNDDDDDAETRHESATSSSVVTTTISDQEATATSMATSPSLPSGWFSSGSERTEEDDREEVPHEHVMMGYLDYCFPFIFPFYRTPMLGTSRGWILYLLQSNTIASNCAASLGSFFHTSVANEILPNGHTRCKAHIWARVMKTADKCYKAIQLELLQLKNGGAVGVSERAAAMGSIVQLMVFDLFVGRSEGWEMHLRPALILLDGMLTEYLDSGSSSYYNGHDRDDTNASQLVWSHEQAAFRFFAALLLYMDVVAAVTLGRAPLLGKWYDQILREDEMNDLSPFLDMSLFVGCANWCLVAVAEIAALDAWKTEAKKNGSLFVPDMVERAAKITRQLDQARRDVDAKRVASANPQAHVSIDVWEHAARIYLAVVVSGWQPLNPEIRNSVQEILGLLNRLRDRDFQDGAAQLRALAWPVCVAGCLADSEAVADTFRDVIQEVMGEMAKFGSMHEALQIMEWVWRNRDTLEAIRCEWDIRTCLSCLKSPVLLV